MKRLDAKTVLKYIALIIATSFLFGLSCTYGSYVSFKFIDATDDSDDLLF